MVKIDFVLQKILIVIVCIYRYFISPVLGQRCRFYPSCSEYAQVALEYHGAWRGIWLAVKRILRCHPWCPGGCDPVPEEFKLGLTQNARCCIKNSFAMLTYSLVCSACSRIFALQRIFFRKS